MFNVYKICKYLLGGIWITIFFIINCSVIINLSLFTHIIILIITLIQKMVGVFKPLKNLKIKRNEDLIYEL